jgi:hypothetical protein
MKLSEILTPSFRSIGKMLGMVIEVFDGRLVIYKPMWSKALSSESTFCRAMVVNGFLTQQQMEHTTRQYRLGATKTGRVIFWQINEHEEIYEGKVMSYLPDGHRDKRHNPTWGGHLLSVRHGWGRLSPRHCFFGLHLLCLTDLTEQGDDLCHTDLTDLTEQGDDLCHTDLTDLTDTESEAKAAKEPKAQKSVRSVRSVCDNKSVRSACVKKSACNTRTICVVEAEKSAVILSEHFPQYLWLASGGLFEMQADKFRPLSGRRVILFPDTDVEGKAFKYWSDMAQLVMRQPFWEDSPPIYVSPILEQQATTEQKERKIDLVDFLFEGVGRSKKELEGVRRS